MCTGVKAQHEHVQPVSDWTGYTHARHSLLSDDGHDDVQATYGRHSFGYNITKRYYGQNLISLPYSYTKTVIQPHLQKQQPSSQQILAT